MIHLHTSRPPVAEMLIDSTPVELGKGETTFSWPLLGRIQDPRPLPRDIAIRQLPRLDLGDLPAVRDFMQATGCVPVDSDLDSRINELTPDSIVPCLAELRAAARHLVIATWFEPPEKLCEEVEQRWPLPTGAVVHRFREASRQIDGLMKLVWSDFDPDEVRANVHETWKGTDVDELSFLAVLNRYIVLTAPPIRPVGTAEIPANGLAALASQLLSHTLSHQPTRQCANETCGQIFSLSVDTTAVDRQRRKSERARTKGVIFCSPQCGRLQNQRDRRRLARKSEES